MLDQASAVAALLEPQYRRLTAGWICLIGRPGVTGRSNSGVRVEGAETFIPALRSLPTVLDIVAVDVTSHSSFGNCWAAIGVRDYGLPVSSKNRQEVPPNHSSAVA